MTEWWRKGNPTSMCTHCYKAGQTISECWAKDEAMARKREYDSKHKPTNSV